MSIVQAAEEVMDGKWDDQFVVDPFQAGAGTSHNMNANEVIANRATQILGGELGAYYVHPNDHVNMAQSTNDTIPTAIRLGALWRVDELLTSLNNLQSALEAKAIEFDDIIKSGRTHLQDAVPVRLGQEFGAYAKAIERDKERVRRSAEGLQTAWDRRHSCRVRFERASRVSCADGEEIIRIDRAGASRHPITYLSRCNRWQTRWTFPPHCGLSRLRSSALPMTSASYHLDLQPASTKFIYPPSNRVHPSCQGR